MIIGLWLVLIQSFALELNVKGFSPGERAEISDEPVNFLTEFSFIRSESGSSSTQTNLRPRSSAQ